MPVVCFDRCVKAMFFASPPQTLRGMYAMGNLLFWLACASGREEWLILFGSEAGEEDRSMSDMSRPWLGSLILSLASGAETSTAGYGVAVGCGSAWPLGEAPEASLPPVPLPTVLLPSTKAGVGVPSACSPVLFSVSSAFPASVYLKSMRVRERWDRGGTHSRGLIDLAMVSLNVHSVYCSERFNAKFSWFNRAMKWPDRYRLAECVEITGAFKMTVAQSGP